MRTPPQLTRPAPPPRAARAALSRGARARRQDLLDVSPLLQDAGAAIVDDSFLRCFQSASSDPWNWNIYLFPLWLVGLVVRYLVLFPIRCARRPRPRPVRRATRPPRSRGR